MIDASLILASADLTGIGTVIGGLAAAGVMLTAVITAIVSSKNRGKSEKQARDNEINKAANAARAETKRINDTYVASLLRQIARLETELAAEQKDNAGHIDQLINLGQPPR